MPRDQHTFCGAEPAETIDLVNGEPRTVRGKEGAVGVLSVEGLLRLS